MLSFKSYELPFLEKNKVIENEKFDKGKTNEEEVQQLAQKRGKAKGFPEVVASGTNPFRVYVDGCSRQALYFQFKCMQLL